MWKKTENQNKHTNNFFNTVRSLPPPMPPPEIKTFEEGAEQLIPVFKEQMGHTPTEIARQMRIISIFILL